MIPPLLAKDIHTRAKIRIALDRIKPGNFGHAKSVGEGVHELKINYGPGYRVYFAFAWNAIVLLLLGGDKASQSVEFVTHRQVSNWFDH